MARNAKSSSNPDTTNTPLPRPSKIDAVVELLRRPEGATLDEVLSV